MRRHPSRRDLPQSWRSTLARVVGAGLALFLALAAPAGPGAEEAATPAKTEAIELPEEIISSVQERLVPPPPRIDPPLRLDGLPLPDLGDKPPARLIVTPPFEVDEALWSEPKKSWTVTSSFGRRLYTLFGGRRARERIAAYDLSQGNYEVALRELHELRRRYPETDAAARAARMLARAYKELGDHEAALAFLIAAKEELEADQAIDVMFEMAILYLQEGEPRLAAHFAEKVVAQSYEKADGATFLLGQAHLEQGNWQEALGAFRRIIESYPFSPYKDEAQFAMAEAQYRLGRLEEAETLWKAYVRAFPLGSMADQALLSLAFCHQALGRSEAAIADLRSVLSDQEGSSYRDAASYALALLLRQTGDLAGASSVLDELARTTGDEAMMSRAEFGVATLWFEQGRLGEALGIFARLAVDDRGTGLQAAAQLMKGTCQYDRQAYRQATAAFEAVPSGAGRELRLESALRGGWSWLRAGEPAKALVTLQGGLGQAATVEEERELKFWIGVARLYLGEWAGAIEALEAARPGEAGPRSREIDLATGYALLANGGDRPAIERFEAITAEEALPRRMRGQALVFLGAARANVRDDAGAVEALEAARGLDPNATYAQQAAFLLGRLLARSGAFDRAEKAFRTFLARYGSGALADQALYELGLTQFQARRYGKAAATFLDLSMEYAASPLAPKALLKRGDALYNLGRYDQAIDAYRSVAELFGDRPEAVEADYGVALTLLKADRFETFAAEVKRFVGAHADSPLAPNLLALLAEAYEERGRVDEASRAYETIVRDFPSSPQAQSARLSAALTMLAGGETNRAIGMLWEIARSPDNPYAPTALLHIARASQEVGDEAGAIEAYRALLEGDRRAPGRDQATLALARLLAARERASEALNLLTDFDQLYPESPLRHQAAVQRALLMAEFGEPEAARRLLDQVAREGRGPAAAEAQFRLAEFIAKSGDDLGAVSEFMKVAYLHKDGGTWVDRARLEAAAAYERSGRRADARKLYEQVAKLGRDDDLRAQARERLRQLDLDAPTEEN